MNGLDAFNTNRRASYDDQQGMQDLVTRKQAGRALSAGDYGGSSSTLYGAGMLDAGRTVQGMGRAEEDRADERAGMEQKAAKDQRLEELGFLKDSATILARIPQDQRQKAFNEAIAPALKMQGMPEDLIAQIQQSPLDDTTLQAFGSQVDEAIKGVVMAPGSQLRDPRTGDLLAEAPFAPKLEKLGEGDTLVEVPGSNPSGAPKGGPRNMRNNNPGNIEDGPFAQSLPGYAGSDGRFAIFTDPKAGSSAQVALLGSYGRRGIKTVQDAISRWAPASDNNDPVAYAKFVAQRLGVSPNQEIDLTDPVIASDMASAIQQFEGGPASKSNGSQPGARVLAQGPAKTPEWAPDGQGNLINQKTGDRKVDPTMKKTGASLAPQDRKYISDTRTAAAQLANTVPLVKRFLKLNEEVGTGGALGNNALASTTAMFNPKVAEMKSITDRLTPAMRQGMPGAASDRDVAMFQSATVGLGKPGPANQAVGQAIIAASKRQSDYVAYLEDYAKKNGSLLGAQEEWDAYAAANPMFDEGSGGKLIVRKTTPWRQYMGADSPAAAPRAAPASGERPPLSAIFGQ